MSAAASLLTDPFLQLPTPNSVRVVWFTEFAGTAHRVIYGQPGSSQLDRGTVRTVAASTSQLSRAQEDRDSYVGGQTPEKSVYERPAQRAIWRHEADVTELVAGERVPYRVESTSDDGEVVRSATFTLSAAPPTGRPLKILLTSDHQLKPMTPANLQKVEETIGRVDAVLMAGDLVNIPDRASEWFDDDRGNAFFPALQGRANYAMQSADGKTTIYRGGALIQQAPLFTAIGNHEVMGRVTAGASLGEQFSDPVPLAAAKRLYEDYAQVFDPQSEPTVQAAWLKDNSFNTDTYDELFALPQSESGGKKYYATTIGDVRLISLYATTIWRSPDLKPNRQSRYRERDRDINRPDNWGYGHHIFEPIGKGSPQYTWLEQELASEPFQRAKYKVVMLHHPPHSLGDNIVPPYTDPVPVFERHPDGRLRAIRYDYPREQDYLVRDVMPLLENAGVQLVLYGHTHIWNRFVSPSGTHYLESSNVGNTYGAYVGDEKRPVPTGDGENYVATGDPNGLEPVVPTIEPLLDDAGQPLPYLSSNNITAFSILDTGAGTVTSYRFDTQKPDAGAIKFDEFRL